MHSPIPINEAEARRSLHAGIDKAVTRSHIKWFVSAPVDVSDPEMFPEVALATCQFTEVQQAMIDAEWESL